MRSIDTNILVRLIAADDPHQTAIAESLLAEGIRISTSVLMETEWVLHGLFRWSRERINTAFVNLLDLEGVQLDRTDGTRWALERHAAGADLADMLHLAEAEGSDGFATFDRRLARAAGKTPPVPVETLG